MLPALGDADNLSTTRILMTISSPSLTITMIVEMTIQNLMTNLFGEHPRMQWASRHQMIPSRQHLENELRQLNQLPCQHYHYIRSMGRSILSQKRRMISGLCHWHPRRHSIKCFNNCIRPSLYIFTRGRIQTKPVSNWLHGQQEICGDMSPLLTT